MREFVQQYGGFVVVGIGAGAAGWLALAYGLAFWFSRRVSHLQMGVIALSMLVFVVILPFAFAPDPLPVSFLPVMLYPCWLIWRRWYGVVVEPGYASARELLRLRRPLVDPPMRNAEAGLFVPLDIVPDTSQRFSWRGLLGGIAILATIPAVLWLIALLDAAFSN